MFHLWPKISFLPLDFFPKAHQDSVLSLLSGSPQLQVVSVSHNRELLTNFPNLRGVIAFGEYIQDWSVLDRVRSLDTVRLYSGRWHRLDSSPFLGSLVKNPQMQELKKVNQLGGVCRLTRLHDPPVDAKYECLPKETLLSELVDDYSLALVRALPHCPAIQTLRLTMETFTQSDLDALSTALLQTPSLQSLSIQVREDGGPLNFSNFPLSTLTSLEIKASCFDFLDSLSSALVASKPQSLTSLNLDTDSGSAEQLAEALRMCPSLTNLSIPDIDVTEVLVKEILCLPLLTSLSLSLPNERFTSSCFSDLSKIALQHLKLGPLSPHQIQLLADALPAFLSLRTLEMGGACIKRCFQDSCLVSLFESFTHSNVRCLTVECYTLTVGTLNACLNLIPNTQLTQFNLRISKVFVVDLKAPEKDTNEDGYKPVDLPKSFFDWNSRFPKVVDRFCVINYY
jgi:hypothetical protein